MLCENCKSATATTHIKRTVNGITKEYYLCPECASKLGFSEFNFFDINDFWGSMLGSQKIVESYTKRCRKCNSSFKEIVESGKMGCPYCYIDFREEIRPTLIKIHGKTEHKGLSPVKASTGVNSLHEEIETLEIELKKAIENEEFEKAAEIRDMLKEKRGEQNG